MENGQFNVIRQLDGIGMVQIIRSYRLIFVNLNILSNLKSATTYELRLGYYKNEYTIT